MNNTEEEDSEIFYDAYERISECQKTSGRDTSKANINTNVFAKCRTETIYQDSIELKEIEKEIEKIIAEKKEQKENEEVISDQFVLQDKSENNFPSDFKQNFDNNSDPNKHDYEIEEKLQQNIYTKRKKTIEMQDEIKAIDIDIEFLRKNLKQIPTKTKGIKDKHFQNLFELQCFQGDSQQILVAKISFGGKYLATGGLSGVLKIWLIYSEEDTMDNYEYKGATSYMRFLNENAFRVYTEHRKEIIDITWHSKKHNLLLSASLDKTVILWDVEKESFINVFEHPAIVSAISFCPSSEEMFFVSGCFDRFVRVWNPLKSKIIDYINIQEYPISIEYFPTGNLIAVGSHNGKISVYETNPKLKYSYSFFCKNKSGKYSDGRKVAGIEFLNKNHALITTNDSSIRLVNINDGKMLQKYKGLTNDEFMIRASFEEIYDLIISASDDGYVYVWKKLIPMSPAGIKNKSYEFFKCFENKENPICSIFVNDISLSAYIKKILMITHKFFIKSIIINTSVNGKIQVLINTET